MRLTSEDLPEPVPPIIPTTSPFFAPKVMPSSEFAPAEPYFSATFLNSTERSFSGSAASFSGEVWETSISRTSSMRFSQATDFVIVMMRFASLMSSVRMRSI